MIQIKLMTAAEMAVMTVAFLRSIISSLKASAAWTEMRYTITPITAPSANAI